MAIIALTVADTVDYVSDEDPSKVITYTPKDPDRPEAGKDRREEIKPGATVFKLRALDVFLMGYIYDNASSLTGTSGNDDVKITTRVNQTNIEAVRHGLLGLTNFSDRQGNAVKFDTQKAVVNGREYHVASDDIINRLGVRLISELASKIKEISEVTPSEEKNS